MWREFTCVAQYVSREDTGRFVKLLLAKLEPSDLTYENVREYVEEILDTLKRGDFSTVCKEFKLSIDTLDIDSAKKLEFFFLSHKKPGELIGPVEVLHGYYIFKIGNKSIDIVFPFKKVREKVIKMYLLEKAGLLEFTIKPEFQKDFDAAAKKYAKYVRETKMFGKSNAPYGDKFFYKVAILQQNTVSDVFRIGNKFFIAKCIERVQPSKEEIQKNITDIQIAYMQKMQSALLNEWYKFLYRSANVIDYRY